MNIRSVKFPKNFEILKFALVGVCSSTIVLFFTALFTSVFGIFYAYSAIMALEVGVATSFFVHEKWTFTKYPKVGMVKIRFTKYNVFSLTGFGINESILILLTNRFGVHYILSESIAILITFGFNYMINKKLTWKK